MNMQLLLSGNQELIWGTDFLERLLSLHSIKTFKSHHIKTCTNIVGLNISFYAEFKKKGHTAFLPAVNKMPKERGSIFTIFQMWCSKEYTLSFQF